MTEHDVARLANLKVALEAKGFALFRGNDDAGRALYIVTRWGMCRQLGGLPELEKFVAQVAPSRTKP